MTGRLPVWQTRVHLNFDMVSKGCEWSACFHEACIWWCRNDKAFC